MRKQTNHEKSPIVNDDDKYDEHDHENDDYYNDIVDADDEMVIVMMI